MEKIFLSGKFLECCLSIAVGWILNSSLGLKTNGRSVRYQYFLNSYDLLELSVIQSITAAMLYEPTTPWCFGTISLDPEVTIITMSRSGNTLINCPPTPIALKAE